jgi:hypothetical protein
MARHTGEARKMRRQLDEHLAAVSDETGVQLIFDCSEEQRISMLLDAIDRKVALNNSLSQADDAELQLRLSTELRLLERHIADLVTKVLPQTTAPTTPVSAKARRAANARWNRGAS